MSEISVRNLRRLPVWYRSRRMLIGSLVFVQLGLVCSVAFPAFANCVYFLIELLPIGGRRQVVDTRSAVDGLFGYDVLLYYVSTALGWHTGRPDFWTRWPVYVLAIVVYSVSPYLFAKAFARPLVCLRDIKRARAILTAILTLLFVAVAIGCADLVGGSEALFITQITVVHYGHEMPVPRPAFWIALCGVSLMLAVLIAGRVPLDRRAYGIAVTTLNVLLATTVTLGMCAYLWWYVAQRFPPSDSEKTAAVVPLFTAAWAWQAFVRLVLAWPAHRPGMLLCDSCGYDLRGTLRAQHTTCPECGREIEAPRISLADRSQSDDQADS